MDSARNSLIITAGATVVAVVLLFFATGLHPLWPLLWIAPLPILIVAPRMRASAAFGIACVAWFAGSLNMWRYFRNILGTRSREITVAIVIMAIPACAFGLAVLLWRLCMKRNAPVRAALAFPAAWVSYEYLLTITSPHSTFGNIAYTQADFLPLLQFTSIAGVAGISFCVFLLPAAIATGRRNVTIAACGFLALIIAFGAWRLVSVPDGQTITIGLIASDLPENVLPQEQGPNAARLLTAYAERAATLAQQGARVIVLPEKLAVVIDPPISVDAIFQDVADRSKADIVVGLIRVARPVKFNEARIYSPSQPTVLAYDKQHMLPAFESSFRPGHTLTLLPRSKGPWGVAICKDMDFPTLSRDYGKRRIRLLLVPAWDFDDDGWLHNRMAVVRGVESGFTIIRAAKEGLLTVSDDRGRVLAQGSSGSAPFATLLASAPVAHHDTIYIHLGDWFALLAVALFVGILLTLYPI